MANTAPTNFGTDTSCLDSLRTGRLSVGVTLVAEAAYRRLVTPRGTLIGGDDEKNYGIDLAELIGQVATPSQSAALPGQIQAELLKDERIASADVSVSSVTTGPSVAWTITVTCTTASDPFTLVLGVSGVTVELLGLQAGI